MEHATRSSALAPEFVALASSLPPTLHTLLVDGADPSTVSTDDLLNELRVDPNRHLCDLDANVLNRPEALSARACAVLRDAVDSERSIKLDSTDGAPGHELPLKLSQLVSMIGEQEARSLYISLPHIFQQQQQQQQQQHQQQHHHQQQQQHAPPISTGATGDATPPHDIFIRRYTADTRPWINFHADRPQ